MPVGRRRDFVSHADGRRPLGGGAVKMGANFLESLRVGEGRRASLVVSPLSEAGIQRVHLAFDRSSGRLERSRLAKWDVAGFPIWRHLARVDLVTEIAVHNPERPNG